LKIKGSRISPQRGHLHPQKGSPGPKNFSWAINPLQPGHFMGDLQKIDFCTPGAKMDSDFPS
jgi:hypothetical protein